MDEQVKSAKERLEEIEAERKELRTQVKDERTLRLEKAAEMREGRDEKIEKIQVKLKAVQDAIYAYNKLGKVAKVESDIFGIIQKELMPESEVVADSAE